VRVAAILRTRRRGHPHEEGAACGPLPFHRIAVVRPGPSCAFASALFRHLSRVAGPRVRDSLSLSRLDSQRPAALHPLPGPPRGGGRLFSPDDQPERRFCYARRGGSRGIADRCPHLRCRSHSTRQRLSKRDEPSMEGREPCTADGFRCSRSLPYSWPRIPPPKGAARRRPPSEVDLSRAPQGDRDHDENADEEEKVAHDECPFSARSMSSLTVTLWPRWNASCRKWRRLSRASLIRRLSSTISASWR
jgi:hypothetical protein